MLGATEDQHLLARIVQEITQNVGLLRLFNPAQMLADFFHDRVSRCHINLHRISANTGCQLTNLIGESRREQQILTLLWQHFQNLADGVNKTHVQHAVCFVQHQHFDVIEAQCILLMQIEQAARRRHQQVNTTAQCLALGIDVDSAENHGGSKLFVLPIGPNTVMNLSREFASRCEDQCANMARSGPVTAR